MKCNVCGNTSMKTTYYRKEEGYTIRTRKCSKCGEKIKTIEMEYQIYKDTINQYNKIVDIIEKKD